MRSIIIGFGLLILSLLILFYIAKVNFIKGDLKLEVIVAAAALVFFFTGLYFNSRAGGKNHSTETPPPNLPAINYEEIKRSGLTQREHEVLVKMAEGLSNQEIASALFLSESTIKSHVSSILFKMDAKRRTQAVQLAKDKKIIA